MNVLDLFSGIGGFSLGLERAGMRTVAFCEIDPYCDRVLRKHWPNVHNYGDVQQLTVDALRAGGISRIDVICGGFPCQDISVGGAGVGIGGERSGLWREYARLIGEIRPQYVIVENVAALLGRGLDRVLGDLAAIGYDAEWEIIAASDVGAPHDRKRLWLVAYPRAEGRQRVLRDWAWRSADTPKEWPAAPLDSQRSTAAWLERTAQGISPFLGNDDGLPGRLAELQLGVLGNAVVPQIPELIGWAIMRTTWNLDTKRLDWMIAHDWHFASSRDDEYCWLVRYDDDGEMVKQSGLFTSGRDAIDAAMVETGTARSYEVPNE